MIDKTVMSKVSYNRADVAELISDSDRRILREPTERVAQNATESSQKDKRKLRAG